MKAQKGNVRSQKFVERAKGGNSRVWSIGSEGELRYKGTLYVPNDMREEVLKVLH